MSPRFPESKEEKAKRIAGMATRMAGSAASALESGVEKTLASPDVLEQRIAQRLGAAAPAMSPPSVAALAAATAKDGHAKALQLARGEIVAADLSDAALANLESVIRVSNRPAWFVLKNRPQIELTDKNSEFWITRINTALDNMRRVCKSVGCLMIAEDDTRTPIGTGWLIAEGTLVTNAHVARHLAFHKPGQPATDPRGGWRLRPGVGGVVDFGFEHGGNKNVRARISEVLYVATQQEPDMAILRVEPNTGTALPPRIELDLVANRPAGWPATYVFVVGHPAGDLQEDMNVTAVFGALDATKRVSPGQLMQMLGGVAIAHDCSTTNGSSGSPVIDLASYQAIGLHYFGKPGERNEAVFMPAMASHPAILKSRSLSWGI